MPTVWAGAGRRPSRISDWVLRIALAVTLLFATAAVFVGSDALRTATNAEGEATRAYLDAVQPLALRAAFVVEEGMKPGLIQLGDGSDLERLSEDAQGWLRDMEDVRAQWSQLTPPPTLTPAHRRFLTALDEYVTAAAALAEADATTDRAGLLADMTRAGDAAEAAWDEAAGLVRGETERLGVTTPTWLVAS